MFAQMKGRARPIPPCPCGNTCLCHKPTDDRWWIILFVLLGTIGIGLLICGGRGSPPVRHIMVNGKQCTVHWVTDHCTSTGACSGHDEAICP